MDQDTLRAMLREAVREVVAEVLQGLMELDREAFCGNKAEGKTATTREGWRPPSAR
ncbi:hypothetical protein RxyAA322_02910 [Rubrobacter xylanophilus]|uniref:Transposase n=1 Tax=Rubrobacter xylanophilus TaxID=49319 RepID=A0A510HJC0_9ACTN|nr:hypothetical protein RxyAA322_02910 [Rubrobacter xylanophilus]